MLAGVGRPSSPWHMHCAPSRPPDQLKGHVSVQVLDRLAGAVEAEVGPILEEGFADQAGAAAFNFLGASVLAEVDGALAAALPGGTPARLRRSRVHATCWERVHAICWERMHAHRHGADFFTQDASAHSPALACAARRVSRFMNTVTFASFLLFWTL